MSEQTQAIFSQALELPPAAKADLVELLLSSIEQNQAVEEEIDAAWTREANDRFQAYLKGQIAAEPVEQALQALRARHPR
jgi:hypothetical protein